MQIFENFFNFDTCYMLYKINIKVLNLTFDRVPFIAFHRV